MKEKVQNSNIWSFIKEHWLEVVIPLGFTSLWVGSLCLAAFDVVKLPNVPEQKVAIGFGVALILFFIEYAIISFDSYAQHKHKNFSSVLHIPGFFVGLSLAGFLVLAFLFFNGHTSTFTIILAIICVAIPKYISCDLSRNPHHYLKKRKTKQDKDKDNLSSLNERSEKQTITNEVPKDCIDDKPLTNVDDENKPFERVTDLILNDPSSQTSNINQKEDINISNESINSITNQLKKEV